MWETCTVPDLVLRLSPKIKFEITVSLDTKGIIKLTIRKRTDIVMERILKKGMNTNNSKTQNRTVLEATQSKPHKNQGFSRCYGTISSSRITCQYKSGNRSFFFSRSFWKTRTGLCSRHYNRRQLLNRYCITFNQSVLVLIFEGRTNFPTFFFL